MKDIKKRPVRFQFDIEISVCGIWFDGEMRVCWNSIQHGISAIGRMNYDWFEYVNFGLEKCQSKSDGTTSRSSIMDPHTYMSTRAHTLVCS